MENTLNILYGVGDVGFVKNINKFFTKQGYKVESASKYSKKSVREYLKANQECNVVVLVEGLQTDSGYTADELAVLTDDRDVHVVVVLEASHRGTDYMKKLYAAGITSAIFLEGNETNITNVSELILHKRSRKVARTYYGIDSEPFQTDTVTPEQMNNYIAYLRENDGISVQDKYEYIVNELSVEQNRVFLERLPEDLQSECLKSRVAGYFLKKGAKKSGKKSKPVKELTDAELTKLLVHTSFFGGIKKNKVAREELGFKPADAKAPGILLSSELFSQTSDVKDEDKLQEDMTPHIDEVAEVNSDMPSQGKVNKKPLSEDTNETEVSRNREPDSMSDKVEITNQTHEASAKMEMPVCATENYELDNTVLDISPDDLQSPDISIPGHVEVTPIPIENVVMDQPLDEINSSDVFLKNSDETKIQEDEVPVDNNVETSASENENGNNVADDGFDFMSYTVGVSSVLYGNDKPSENGDNVEDDSNIPIDMDSLNDDVSERYEKENAVPEQSYGIYGIANRFVVRDQDLRKKKKKQKAASVPDENETKDVQTEDVDSEGIIDIPDGVQGFDSDSFVVVGNQTEKSETREIQNDSDTEISGKTADGATPVQVVADNTESADEPQGNENEQLKGEIQELKESLEDMKKSITNSLHDTLENLLNAQTIRAVQHEDVMENTNDNNNEENITSEQMSFDEEDIILEAEPYTAVVNDKMPEESEETFDDIEETYAEMEAKDIEHNNVYEDADDSDEIEKNESYDKQADLSEPRTDISIEDDRTYTNNLETEEVETANDKSDGQSLYDEVNEEIVSDEISDIPDLHEVAAGDDNFDDQNRTDCDFDVLNDSTESVDTDSENIENENISVGASEKLVETDIFDNTHSDAIEDKESDINVEPEKDYIDTDTAVELYDTVYSNAVVGLSDEHEEIPEVMDEFDSENDSLEAMAELDDNTETDSHDEQTLSEISEDDLIAAVPISENSEGLDSSDENDDIMTERSEQIEKSDESSVEEITSELNKILSNEMVISDEDSSATDVALISSEEHMQREYEDHREVARAKAESIRLDNEQKKLEIKNAKLLKQEEAKSIKLRAAAERKKLAEESGLTNARRFVMKKAVVVGSLFVVFIITAVVIVIIVTGKGSSSGKSDESPVIRRVVYNDTEESTSEEKKETEKESTTLSETTTAETTTIRESAESETTTTSPHTVKSEIETKPAVPPQTRDATNETQATTQAHVQPQTPAPTQPQTSAPTQPQTPAPTQPQTTQNKDPYGLASYVGNSMSGSSLVSLISSNSSSQVTFVVNDGGDEVTYCNSYDGSWHSAAGDINFVDTSASYTVRYSYTDGSGACIGLNFMRN